MSGNQPNFSTGRPSGRSSTEIASDLPGGETQTRPSRPLPPVWFSVTITARSGSSGALRTSTSFVDTASGNSWTTGTTVRLRRSSIASVCQRLRCFL